MMWYLFLILSLMSGFFFIMGYSTKTRLWVQIGSIFLIFIGLSIISTGLSLPSGLVAVFT